MRCKPCIIGYSDSGKLSYFTTPRCGISSSAYLSSLEHLTGISVEADPPLTREASVVHVRFTGAPRARLALALLRQWMDTSEVQSCSPAACRDSSSHTYATYLPWHALIRPRARGCDFPPANKIPTGQFPSSNMLFSPSTMLRFPHHHPGRRHGALKSLTYLSTDLL